MNRKVKKDKLIKYLNGQALPSEVEEVNTFIEDPSGLKELEEMMIKDWQDCEIGDEGGIVKILEGIHEKVIPISKSVGKPVAKTAKLNFFSKVAASLALIAEVVFLLLNQGFREEKVISKLPPKVYQKKTGFGEKLRITLPDKSIVVLNSLSNLSFTSDFGKMDRFISLQGEAFFEVTPNPSLPFKVATGEVITTALGTEFNASSREGKVIIALTEGKVSVTKPIANDVQEVLLSPGEMVMGLLFVEDNLVVETFDEQTLTAWKEGKIHFKSKPLENIFADLQTWYGVSLEYSGKVDKKRKVTGEFDNESLVNILEGLTFSMGIHYELEGTKVIIKQ